MKLLHQLNNFEAKFLKMGYGIVPKNKLEIKFIEGVNLVFFVLEVAQFYENRLSKKDNNNFAHFISSAHIGSK
jgi:hypothetical protein